MHESIDYLSREDGYNTATLEAMAAGLPIVASDSAGTAQLIRNGETGMLVPAQDGRALAEQTTANACRAFGLPDE